MSPAPTHHIAKCFAKTRRDRAGAEKTAAQLRAKHPGSNAYAYECAICRFWHVSCNCGDAKFKAKNARNNIKRKFDQRVRDLKARIDRENDN